MSALTEYREKLGWSKAKLARATNVSDTAISAVEDGTRGLTLGMSEKLALALGVDAVALFTIHSLDQLESVLRSTPKTYMPSTLSHGIARVKAALDINRELELLVGIPPEMLERKALLVDKIADELGRLEQAMRGIEPTPRRSEPTRVIVEVPRRSLAARMKAL